MKNKTIVFDLRALQIGHQDRGIGMVIRSLIEHTKNDSSDYVFYIFDDSDPIKDLSINTNGLKFKYIKTPRLKTSIKSPGDIKDILKLTFLSFKELRSIKFDTFVQFDFNLGAPKFSGAKIVTVAYDLIPLIMAKEYLPTPFFAFSHTNGKKAKIKAFLRAAYYRTRLKHNYKIYRRADAIVAISETVRQSFIDLLHVKPTRITTIGLAPVASEVKFDNKVLKKLDLQEKPYIFYIGGPDSRKRVEEVIYAFNITKGRGSDIKLVIAGKEFAKVNDIPNGPVREAIKASPYKDEIILAGFVTDAEKNSLYANAHAFVFCSIYEGFGLPVLEAHKLGCPVVAYGNSAVQELSKDAAILAETNNYVSVAAGIGRLFDQAKRNELSEKGKKIAEKYSWDTFASEFNTLT